MSATTDAEFEAQLRLEFLDEAAYLLEACEEAILGLETGDPAEQLTKVFRAAHTVKGSGAAVGFADLVTFAHEFEDLLSQLRVDPARLTPQIVSLLLRGTDALKERIRMLKSGTSKIWDVVALKAELRTAAEHARGRSEMQPTIAAPISKVVEPVPSSTPPASNDAKSKGASTTSLKVDAARLDGVLDVVGELVVIKSQLLTKAAQYGNDAQLLGMVGQLDAKVRELQDRSLAIRMTPFRPLFLKAQRVVRDLSSKLGKPVDFVTTGEEIEVDRLMIEALGDPLMHLLRNAMDHGVEAVAKRRASGKPDTGRIELAASLAGGRIVVEIRDDGAGIDRQAVWRKALERGLVGAGSSIERMTDREVNGLILMPGFSTAANVSEVSGRGVGMDVVKSQVERLRGDLQINSTQGRGTSFRIELPLTASITDGMHVVVDGRSCIIGLESIRELVQVSSGAEIEIDGGTKVLRVRDRLLPIVRLRDWISRLPDDAPQSSMSSGTMIIVEDLGRGFALEVDAVLGQIQVVLKTMSHWLRDVRGVAGAAVLGDGRVALVLDVHGLVARAEVEAA